MGKQLAGTLALTVTGTGADRSKQEARMEAVFSDTSITVSKRTDVKLTAGASSHTISFQDMASCSLVFLYASTTFKAVATMSGTTRTWNGRRMLVEGGKVTALKVQRLAADATVEILLAGRR